MRALVALVLLGGCAVSPPRGSLPAVDLTILDERPEATDVVRYRSGAALDATPLLLWYGAGRSHQLRRSFATVIRDHLRARGAFVAVTGVGDPGRERGQATHRLTVALRATDDRSTHSNYGLGLYGFVLHWLGLPRALQTTTVGLRLTLSDSAGRALAQGEVRRVHRRLRWVHAGYRPERGGSGRVVLALRGALDEGVARLAADVPVGSSGQGSAAR